MVAAKSLLVRGVWPCGESHIGISELAVQVICSVGSATLDLVASLDVCQCVDLRGYHEA